MGEKLESRDYGVAVVDCVACEGPEVERGYVLKKIGIGFGAKGVRNALQPRGRADTEAVGV